MDHIDHLQKLAAAYEAAVVRAEDARHALADAIRAAAEDEVRQVDIVNATGYTREQIRRIVRGTQGVRSTDADQAMPRGPWPA